MLIISHCEDLQLTGDGVMNEGYMSTVLGVKGHNPCRRGSDGSRDIILAETLKRLSILPMSAREDRLS